MKNIYGIYDNVSRTLAGPLHIFPADAAAVRMFGDIASDPQTLIARHPQDFDLVRLGSLDEEGPNLVEQMPETILTGELWAATQKAAEDNSASNLSLTGTR